MTQPYELKDVLVKIDGLSVRYGDTPVLTDLSAEVRDIVRPGCITGQIVGILGPSGIGKTQFSRVVTGLQEPTTGTVLVGPKQEPVRAGLVGYVAQHYPLLRHRTILSNLMVASICAGRSEAESRDRSMEHLKRFQLEDKWAMYPAELSGGQRQRVAIIQQILSSEHLLIFDEPTTGLDPIAKDRVCDTIRTVSSLSEENTIFVVTHDIAAILTIADRLWLLGRRRNEKGESLGANIKFEFNLIERGLAWEPDVANLPAYTDTMREVRARFSEL